MKKIVAVNLLTIVFLLMSCKVGDEDDTAGNQTCDRYDQAVNVAFVTTSVVDSVQFFMNGVQVCIPYDSELFRNNQGSQGFQGSFYNINTRKFGCVVGTLCDRFEGDLNDFLIKVYSLDKTDSILLTRDGLAKMAYNKAYQVFHESDTLSSLMWFLKEDQFVHIGCQGEFCIAERSSESLLCIDSHSDTPEKEFKNICESWDSFQY